MAVATCARLDCPLVESGTCLDGIDPPQGCPNFLHAAEVETQTDSVESPLETAEPSTGSEIDAVVGAEGEGDEVDDDYYFGGDEALTIEDANRLTASEACRVVLIAGEFESGKSTLAIEWYAQFLRGRFDGWTFAGSDTLLALDEMHRHARISSGRDSAATERTRHEDMRLLHLALEGELGRTNLLISDVKGEFFEHVADGAAIGLEVPIAARADVCFVLINGERLADLETRALELFRADQLIRGLTGPGGVRTEAQLVLVCSKRDRLPPRIPKALRDELSALGAYCAALGYSVQHLELSARPSGGATPLGLTESLTIATTPAARLERRSSARVEGERYFWAARVVGDD